MVCSKFLYLCRLGIAYSASLDGIFICDGCNAMSLLSYQTLAPTSLFNSDQLFRFGTAFPGGMIVGTVNPRPLTDSDACLTLSDKRHKPEDIVSRERLFISDERNGSIKRIQTESLMLNQRAGGIKVVKVQPVDPTVSMLKAWGSMEGPTCLALDPAGVTS